MRLGEIEMLIHKADWTGVPQITTVQVDKLEKDKLWIDGESFDRKGVGDAHHETELEAALVNGCFSMMRRAEYQMTHAKYEAVRFQKLHEYAQSITSHLRESDEAKEK